MSARALGLIETMGLIGAIEATDAAAKAAMVVISSVEVTDAAFLTLKIEGDLGAVQAAVDAGAQAAEKVGELIAVHIIPRPDEGLAPILPPLRYVSKYRPDETRPPLDLDEGEQGLTKKPRPPKPPAPSTIKLRPSEKLDRKRKTPEKKIDIKKDKLDKKELNRLTVSELRRIARSLARIPLKGREISMANKKQLMDAIRSVIDMD